MAKANFLLVYHYLCILLTFLHCNATGKYSNSHEVGLGRKNCSIVNNCILGSLYAGVMLYKIIQGYSNVPIDW